MNENEKSQPKRALKPPYLSLSCLEKVFNLLSTRKLNEVSFNYFVKQGLGKSDAYTATVALRFLGLIDDQDKMTDLAKKFHLQGEPKIKAIQTMVHLAYSKLFDTVTEPQNLSKKELENEFIAQYNVTIRIARTAVPVFLWLCEMAELREKTLEPRRRGSTNKRAKDPNSRAGVMRSVSFRERPITKLDVIRDVLTSMSGADQETIKAVMGGLKDLLQLSDEPKRNENEDNKEDGA